MVQSVRIGFWVFCLQFVWASGMASECGILRLQGSRSYGAEVYKNTCAQAENLSKGTRLKLKPNSRLWLNSIHAVANTSTYKMVCQNQSSATVELSLETSFIPWIRPDSKVICGDWVEQRLECKEPGANKVALVCAIAKNNEVEVTHEVLQSASITLRGGKNKNDTNQSAITQNAALNAIIEKELNPKIALCEKFYDQEKTITWTINPNGKVTAIALKNSVADRFTRCVFRTIKAQSFPAAAKAIQISSSYSYQYP